ncbi:putative methyltransferase-domain-containing protein [Panaeolus papilionaceus]|nr:putative methyltransferase-domain-containing protein [Panaeolus papilionaceus]
MSTTAPLETYQDPEDFLFDSLQTMYDYHPITLTTSGARFTYVPKQNLSNCTQEKLISITLDTPDTAATNWALHASSIWVSSIYLADHINELDLKSLAARNDEPLELLELGASAGLPSIMIAKSHPNVRVTVTDYPDEQLIKTLSANVTKNDVSSNCRALPYAWGTDPAPILPRKCDGFDVVVAADTLWNSELHDIFIDALKQTLKKRADARVHIVVGLHTGRYTIQSFLLRVQNSGFDAIEILEREASGNGTRSWNVGFAEGEDEKERRRWVIWIQLAWSSSMIKTSCFCT